MHQFVANFFALALHWCYALNTNETRITWAEICSSSSLVWFGRSKSGFVFKLHNWRWNYIKQGILKNYQVLTIMHFKKSTTTRGFLNKFRMNLHRENCLPMSIATDQLVILLRLWSSSTCYWKCITSIIYCPSIYVKVHLKWKLCICN